MKREGQHGGRRPGAGRPTRFRWSTALLAAATVATSGGVSHYDRARQRRGANVLPSRPTLWRWERRRDVGSLFGQVMRVAERLAAGVRDGLPGARDRAADFALAAHLLSLQWENGESVGPVEDTPEFRAELRAVLADFKRGPWR